jgi:hypothetical protein
MTPADVPEAVITIETLFPWVAHLAPARADAEEPEPEPEPLPEAA